MMKKIPIFVILVCFTFLFSSCLKTRAQLREDSNDREGASSAPAQPVQDVQPQGQYVIDEIKDEITRIEGKLEDLQRLSSQGNPAEKEELKKLDARMVQLEQTQAGLVETIKKLQETPAAVDPNELFKKAKSYFDDGEYDAAAESFGSYLKTPKVKKLEEAIFLRGEAYFNLKEHKKAIIEYSKFPEKFPHSVRMPDALYKIGLCFDALGMKDDAKGFYQELIEKFPKSAEAKKARKKV